MGFSKVLKRKKGKKDVFWTFKYSLGYAFYFLFLMTFHLFEDRTSLTQLAEQNKWLSHLLFKHVLFNVFACTFITHLLGYNTQWYHLSVLLELKQSKKKKIFWLWAALCCFYDRWTRKQCWAGSYLSFLSLLAKRYFRAWQLTGFVWQLSYLKITNKNPSNLIPSSVSNIRF